MRKRSIQLNQYEDEFLAVALNEENDGFYVVFHCKITNQTEAQVFSTDSEAKKAYNDMF